MTPIQAAVHHYRAALASAEDDARERHGDLAQNYAVIAAVSLAASLIVAALAILAGRCFAEALGAAVAGQWAACATSGAYGATWIAVAWTLRSGTARAARTVLDGLDSK